MNSEKPIGVFDSGIGGLTVLKEIRHHLPEENILYFGDEARFPYGIKSAEAVTRFSHEIAAYLVGQDIKMLVVACNTASSVALNGLREGMEVPVIGVLMPGAYAAARETKTGRVGIIGTEGTVNSGVYARLIRNIRPGTEVMAKPCPLFVPMVEEGRLSGEITRLVALEYLAPLKDFGVDTLVLGCTHYPLLKAVIADVMGPDVTLVDSAHETAQEVGRVLAKQGLLNGSGRPGYSRYYVTDAPGRFKTLGERFLGYDIPSVEMVELS
jgi:glutamate racemase